MSSLVIPQTVSGDKLLFNSNDFLRDKRLISISPGGFKGIYMLGICMFIKDHFDLDNYVFSGASAGAWNALTMCYKKDPKKLKSLVLDYSLNNSRTNQEILKTLKDRFLLNTNTDDFDLDRLFIGVTALERLKTKTNIYYGFTNLDDALDCCIASSHIPFVTGGLVNKYRNLYSFDGGFSKYPYVNHLRPTIHVSPSIWKDHVHERDAYSFGISQYTTLFSRDNFDFKQLYESGYNDSRDNFEYLKYVLE
jgi:hypothetical protein